MGSKINLENKIICQTIMKRFFITLLVTLSLVANVFVVNAQSQIEINSVEVYVNLHEYEGKVCGVANFADFYNRYLSPDGYKAKYQFFNDDTGEFIIESSEHNGTFDIYHCYEDCYYTYEGFSTRDILAAPYDAPDVPDDFEIKGAWRDYFIFKWVDEAFLIEGNYRVEFTRYCYHQTLYFTIGKNKKDESLPNKIIKDGSIYIVTENATYDLNGRKVK